MPARQDQTLQIFLIVCIFAFLVTAVVAYLGWKGYGEEAQRTAGLETTLSGERGTVANQRTEIETYRQKMGFGPQDNPESVLKSIDDDLKRFGPGTSPEESRSYRKVLETVYTEAQQTAAREAALKDQLEKLTTQAAGVEAAAQKQIAQYDQQRKEAEERLAAATNTFNQDRETLENTKKELKDTVDKQQSEFQAKLDQYAAEKKGLEEQIAELTKANDILKSQRKDEPGSFEIADGRISWVNQDGTVWINLGSADSLRRQVTFSVFDKDQHDAAKAEKKASIEVTRILRDHLAEARITNDDPTNPILTGDSIYSQIWHRGKKLHFALTGIIDVDGDGRSDMQLARDFIELNGGELDAYLADDGSIQGKITANTRYLVLGDLPESATQAKHSESWNAMYAQAVSLGVETITLSEFLNQMGYKPQDRTVRLGAGANAQDFPPRPLDSSGRPGAAPRFRPRTPNRATAPTSTTSPQ
jgi:hypothetical protein